MTDLEENIPLHVSFVGDVYLPNLPGTAQWDAFYQNFYAPLTGSDLILANYEAPIVSSPAQPRENKPYNLHHQAESLDLFDDRFILSLANNHIMDFGEAGLRATLESLREKSISFAGAGRNIEEASTPVYRKNKRQCVAFVCAADPRFQPAGQSTPGTMPAKIGLLNEVLQEASQRADRIVVSIHAGMEFTRVPTPYMKRLAECCALRGVSLLNFHHAHCISGHTRLDDTDILWGLGNYCFPRPLPAGFMPWFDSIAARVTWEKSLKGSVIDLCPVHLSRSGFPSATDAIQTKRINRIMKNCSQRIQSSSDLPVWRLTEILRPSYIRLASVNYFLMARHMGLRELVRFIFLTLRLYFKGGDSDDAVS